MNLKRITPFVRIFWAVMVLSILTGCTQAPTVTPTPLPSTPTLPDPGFRVTPAPDAQSAARQFIEAWQADDYAAMYARLDTASRQAVTEEDFTRLYQETAQNATLEGIDFDLSPATMHPNAAQINTHLTLHSIMVGDIVRDVPMSLVREEGEWRIQWSPSLILPEMANGAYLSMDLQVPQRGAIYDRNGQPLVDQEEATAVGLMPDYIDPEFEGGLLSLLSRLTGLRADTIAGMYENYVAGSYLALAEVPTEENADLIDALSGYGAAVTSNYSSRFYYEGGIAPHLVGYVSALQESELAEFRRRGYPGDARIGRKGIEQWGESYLAGKPGGALYLFDNQGKMMAKLGESPAEPGVPIYTTIDRDFQAAVQRSIASFRGAVVVIEIDTGRVLAMASSPSFDPNAYEFNNYNSGTLISNVINDPRLPEFNRATTGLYPLGSVFKVITTAAGLESGFYTPETEYDCQYEFRELGGLVLYDWTWEHFQEDEETQPSGLLTLREGLMRSCNPFFWHIGLDLFNRGLTTAVSDMARAFGLGEKTGIEGVDELPGAVLDPGEAVGATNLAVGQGDLQVTPLQVARFMAAMGNGGTLYRPQVIERVGSEEAPVMSFEPEEQGTLPIKPENLLAIQESMVGVVRSRTPRGTAYNVFDGLSINVAGKTGTAQAGPGLEPHAWFAGYTFQGSEERPDIAIAVLVENIGEGSDFAAPIFRRVVEEYFFGKPMKLYRWESTFNVTRTPTPLVTDTATPEPGEEGEDGEGQPVIIINPEDSDQ